MHDQLVFFVVGVLLFKVVEGQNDRHNIDNRHNGVKDSEPTLDGRVICVKQLLAFIRLEIHLKQYLKRNRQQNA